LQPSISPTKTPTQSPTSRPSSNPSFSPTSKPTPINTLSLDPTNKPTLSSVPSSAPSKSQIPTELRVNVEISPFVIDLVSENGVDENVVVEVAENYLNDFLKDKFTSDIVFSNVELRAERTTRRRLNVKTSILCSGYAVFNSKSVPSTDLLEELVVEDAFTNSKEDFLEQLENSGIELSQLLDVSPKEQPKGLTKMHLTIIFAIGGVATVAIAVSLYIQWHHRHSNEKKVQIYGQQYQFQSKLNEYNLDIDYLEPQPLEISDDDRAIERNMVRSEYERIIIRKANTSLRQRIGDKLPSRETKAVRFGSNIAYGSNGTVVDENRRYDEEATISSIQFSSSLESNISSLGGLNPIPEYDETNTKSLDNSPSSTGLCNAFQDENLTPRSCIAMVAEGPTQQPQSPEPEPEIIDLPPKSPRSLSVAVPDNTDDKESRHNISSAVIGVLSPQSILSSIGFSFGSEPFQLDSLDEDSDAGDEPTIDSALYNFSVSTAELPANAQIQVSTDAAADDAKSQSSRSRRSNFLKRLASPRKSKNNSQQQVDNETEKVAAIITESKDEDNFLKRLTSPRKSKRNSQHQVGNETEKVAAIIADLKGEDNPSNVNKMDQKLAASISPGQDYPSSNNGQLPAEPNFNISPNREEIQNIDHVKGNATDQNAQGENSYFTSIFTRKY
jgi:hypothetical protein